MRICECYAMSNALFKFSGTSLYVKDTLGPANLSTVEGLSTLQR